MELMPVLVLKWEVTGIKVRAHPYLIKPINSMSCSLFNASPKMGGGKSHGGGAGRGK